MGRFPFKRPRIISKKFPEMDNHIDAVTKSLEALVFSYSHHVDKTLQRKHLMMAISSLALLVVLGSFISPTGKADSSIFYPKTCLGGWTNPHNAEGEPQTTSNGDASQFTVNNSAVLQKNTIADIYCGNFTGVFDEGTKPTKILISLAMTKGDEVLLEEIPIITASSSDETLNNATSTSITDLASTTLELASSSASDLSTTTDIVPGTTTASVTGDTEITEDIATSSLPAPVTEQATSLVSDVVDSVKDAITNFFETNKKEPQTDTVVIPPPVEESTPSPAEAVPPAEPTSFLYDLLLNLAYNFGTIVFAQESAPTVEQVAIEEPTPVVQTTEEPSPAAQTIEESTPTAQEVVQPIVESVVDSTSTPQEETTSLSASSTSVTSTSSLTEGTTTFATTTNSTSTEVVVVATTTTEEENHFQNNFLEVFYTFDGHTWESLGELNDISMKYRTFEIPVTASTSWSDMSQLQIKIASKNPNSENPPVYLDGIKAEVLYETSLVHVHPDFNRDTIIKDEVIGDMRIVTIINNDTNQEEIWYMYLEAANASSTEIVASSTLFVGTTTESTSTSTEDNTKDKDIQTLEVSGTSTESHEATTTAPLIKPIIPKNKWIKFEGDITKGISGEAIYNIIKEKEENPKQKRSELPDFTLDIIKKIKGTFFGNVIVQVEKENNNELWLYTASGEVKEKIAASTSTTVSSTFPLGMKDGHLLWLSEDESTVYDYDLFLKVLQEQKVPEFNGAKGERAEVLFQNNKWKVIISSEGFSFFSLETGEVFSDDNGSIADVFRKKLELDKLLDTEELGNLNLPEEIQEATKEDGSQ